MKVKALSKKEIRELNDNVQFEISKKDAVERVEDDIPFIKINGIVKLFYYEGRAAPTVKTLLQNNYLPKVTVDMGAVKFVVSGADIMRPGIVSIEEFDKDAFVAIIDVNNQKPLAVGVALMSSEEMEKQEKGKSIKNIHYVGDPIWFL